MRAMFSRYSICLLIHCLVAIPVCHSIEYRNTADECIALASKHIDTIDGIISDKSAVNKSQQLRMLQDILRDCSLVTRGTKYESLFYDVSGMALQMSAIINDTDNYRLMTTLEDKHIEIISVLEQIAR